MQCLVRLGSIRNHVDNWADNQVDNQVDNQADNWADNWVDNQADWAKSFALGDVLQSNSTGRPVEIFIAFLNEISNSKTFEAN